MGFSHIPPEEIAAKYFEVIKETYLPTIESVEEKILTENFSDDDGLKNHYRQCMDVTQATCFLNRAYRREKGESHPMGLLVHSALNSHLNEVFAILKESHNGNLNGEFN